VKRIEFPAKIKDLAFARSEGKCEKCGMPFNGARPQYDHVLPAELGGKSELANCQVLDTACHAAKTKDDVRGIRKADRQRRASVGAEREKQKITQRAKEERPKLDKLPVPPPRALYRKA
jgi:5-methylcytosine-specific restriction endonuclease McrA